MIGKEQVLANLTELEAALGEKGINRLGTNKLRRIIERLDQFSAECETCRQALGETHDHITALREQHDPRSETVKSYNKSLSQLSSHLQQVHKLIPEGYYIAIYMPLGMSLGIVFGLTLLDNLALGLPIGLSIGLAIGAGQDASAKKQGKTI